MCSVMRDDCCSLHSTRMQHIVQCRMINGCCVSCALVDDNLKGKIMNAPSNWASFKSFMLASVDTQHPSIHPPTPNNHALLNISSLRWEESARKISYKSPNASAIPIRYSNKWSPCKTTVTHAHTKHIWKRYFCTWNSWLFSHFLSVS